MIGDRLNTDIEFGRRGGLQTLLVLSGVTSPEGLCNIEDENQKPDFFVDSINVLNLLQTYKA